MSLDNDEELQKTVELWRAMADNTRTPEPNATTLRWCADELEKLFEIEVEQ